MKALPYYPLETQLYMGLRKGVETIADKVDETIRLLAKAFSEALRDIRKLNLDAEAKIHKKFISRKNHYLLKSGKIKKQKILVPKNFKYWDLTKK